MVAPDPGAGLQPVHPAPGVSPRGPAHVVLVAGRRAAMLLGLKRLLEPAFEVVGMPDNVLSLLDALRDFSPALLVMDTGSPEFGGADLPWRLRTRFPRLRILARRPRPGPRHRVHRQGARRGRPGRGGPRAARAGLHVRRLGPVGAAALCHRPADAGVSGLRRGRAS
jgi:hypothetical protein